MRRTRNSVLPAPGPATTNWGPSVVDTASGQSEGVSSRSTTPWLIAGSSCRRARGLISTFVLARSADPAVSRPSSAVRADGQDPRRAPRIPLRSSRLPGRGPRGPRLPRDGQAARGGSAGCGVGPSTTVNLMPTSRRVRSASAKAWGSLVCSSLVRLFMVPKVSPGCDKPRWTFRGSGRDGLSSPASVLGSLAGDRAIESASRPGGGSVVCPNSSNRVAVPTAIGRCPSVEYP